MTDTDQRTNQISDLESGFDGEKEKSPKIFGAAHRPERRTTAKRGRRGGGEEGETGRA